MAKIIVQPPDSEPITHELGGGATTIGRDTDNAITIADGSVSRHHAEITFVDGVFTLRDLGSANGCAVNWDPVTDTSLKDGDVIHFGVVQTTLVAEPLPSLPEPERAAPALIVEPPPAPAEPEVTTPTVIAEPSLVVMAPVAAEPPLATTPSSAVVEPVESAPAPASVVAKPASPSAETITLPAPSAIVPEPPPAAIAPVAATPVVNPPPAVTKPRKATPAARAPSTQPPRPPRPAVVARKTAPAVTPADPAPVSQPPAPAPDAPPLSLPPKPENPAPAIAEPVRPAPSPLPPIVKRVEPFPKISAPEPPTPARQSPPARRYLIPACVVVAVLALSAVTVFLYHRAHRDEPRPPQIAAAISPRGKATKAYWNQIKQIEETSNNRIKDIPFERYPRLETGLLDFQHFTNEDFESFLANAHERSRLSLQTAVDLGALNRADVDGDLLTYLDALCIQWKSASDVDYSIAALAAVLYEQRVHSDAAGTSALKTFDTATAQTQAEPDPQLVQGNVQSLTHQWLALVQQHQFLTAKILADEKQTGDLLAKRYQTAFSSTAE